MEIYRGGYMVTSKFGVKKIQKHPEFEYIQEQLYAGTSTREIERYLKIKYSDAAQHISYMSLQSYRKHELQLDGTKLKEIQKKRKKRGEGLLVHTKESITTYHELLGKWKKEIVRCGQCGADVITNREVDKITKRYQQVVQQAIDRGKVWELTQPEWVELILQPCTYCDRQIGNVGVGLDRIDNRFGYTKENVLSCCGECNLVRGTRLTVEETRAAMQAVLSLRRES